MIQNVSLSDATQLAEIYNHYIDHSIATFDEQPISAEQMSEKISSICCEYPWIVYRDGDVIVGYAYASTFKPREAYRFTAETTIYIRDGYQRRGIGVQLYDRLIDMMRERDFHVLTGCISLPNEPSVALHEQMGFRKVGHFTEVGYKFGEWIDVGYWELRL